MLHVTKASCLHVLIVCVPKACLHTRVGDECTKVFLLTYTYWWCVYQYLLAYIHRLWCVYQHLLADICRLWFLLAHVSYDVYTESFLVTYTGCGVSANSFLLMYTCCDMCTNSFVLTYTWCVYQKSLLINISTNTCTHVLIVGICTV